MAISAFAVKVPAAEALVGDLRRRYDATVALGVPAHITVLVPFMDPALITPDVLALAQRVLDRTTSFTFSLSEVGRFPETAYLAPEPAEPFVAMTLAMADAFPGFPPYEGAFEGVIPHLSVAHGNALDADAAAIELQARLLASGPVHATCTEVTLIENSSGRWQDLHVFQLPPAGARAMRNVLFICSRNQWRSPTAEQLWRRHPLISARSAGTSPNARHRVSIDDIEWADLILVMEEKHKSRLVAEFKRTLEHKPIHVLDIPDEYKYMDPALIEELERSVPSILGID
ncbi:2'-5' RNA ligase family protein [Variovorax sp. VaC1]|uniref:2'-5' RNA ligase family protein n=1 Tax=Variovorax sp. VaC1 TaxID=3373132 RepID=UPI0037486613